jgi:hypothetical protein
VLGAASGLDDGEGALEADALDGAGDPREAGEGAQLVEAGDVLEDLPDVLLLDLEGQRVGVGLGEAEGVTTWAK